MPTVLDFEDLPPWTWVTAQYGPRGVIFQAFLDTDPAAHSGTRVLRSIKLSEEVFEPFPFVMRFTTPQSRVKLFASSTYNARNGTLTAFDAANNVVAQDGPKLVAANVFTTMFEVVDPDLTPSITRAELRLEDGIYFAIDDLEFEGEPAAEPPAPPVVEITAPVNGAELDVSTVDIAGTVTGEGLLSPAKLTVIFGRPPEDPARPFTSVVDLIGTGTTRQFSLIGFSGVPLGPITVTVTAQNFGALTGTASVTFTNLPVAIKTRLDAEGGAASMGALRFGLFADGCRIAVYQLGAISVDDLNTTRVIRGDIFVKWLSLRSINDVAGIGCPLGEERDGPPGSRAQDFARGRIYSHPTIGTFSVPAVFVDAIDKRGGENATGIPIAEPTSSPGAMQTWLFQRFTRPNRPDLEPSTLEIRGSPPVLTIERQGGDLSYPAPGGGSTEFSATLWEPFSCCDGAPGPCLGPCSVEPTPEEPPPIADAGNLFCQGTTYNPFLRPLGPPEWVPILDSHYVSTPIFGVAVDSHLAHVPPGDNPLTHEVLYGDPTECILTGGLTYCPSDWNVQIWPIGPQRGIAPFTSIKAGNTYVELEWEDYYGRAAFLRKDLMEWDWPRVGDLIFAAGRWIIDCGHDSYNSELHPVFMLALMKGVQFQGRLATRADIWVNGWYPGDPIEFDIFPPPRPTPESVLTLNKPVDADAAFNVDLEFGFAPISAPDHIHVKFTASPRQVHVTNAGEMKFESGRGYEGQWFVGWDLSGLSNGGQFGGLDFEPTVVNFGSVTVGQEATRTLTVRNSLGRPVSFSLQAAPGGSVFQWAAASGMLANGAETTFTLRFRPVSNAIEQTTLRVTSTAPGSPHPIGLLGKGPGGFPPPNGEPKKTLDFHSEPINFGSVRTGTVATRTLTIENQTGRTVNLSFPAGSGVFSWSAFSGSLAHGMSRGFELTFRPASSAIARGQLLVTSDAAGSPHPVGLIGKGLGGF